MRALVAGRIATNQRFRNIDEEDERNEKQEQIWSWGAGTDGQLGTGKLEDDLLPQLLRVPPLAAAGPISMLACGGAHVIALTTGGRVLTWGRGTSGQLGHGDTLNCLTPKVVESLDNDVIVTHVSAGWSHSGFVSDKGCLFTCGDGSFGQLGHGDHSNCSSPVKVSYFDSSKHVDQMACGMRHSLVLLKGSLGNQIYGFGSGKRGQLGVSAEKVKSASHPRVTLGFEDVEIASVSANGDHSAALSGDGKLYTWGRGFSGSPDSNVPFCSFPSLRFDRVALGWNHALLLDDDGEVYMLGGNRHGVLSDAEKMINTAANHLPDSSTEAGLERVLNPGGAKVVQIAAGSEHSALVTIDGAVMTWGWGEHGQLGLGSTSDETNPQPIRNIEKEAVTSSVYCGSGFTYVIKSVHS